MIVCIAVEFFIDMLGPEEEGKINHVTEIEISERSTGKRMTNDGSDGTPVVYTPLVKLFKEQLAGNKPKKGKKGKKGKGKKGKKKK